MRIGVTYDLRSVYLALGYSEEDTAEFDVEPTIDGICDALAGLGYEVDRIGGIKNLIVQLAAGVRWDCVFNYCEGLHGLAREAQAPAILEAFEIPYVFSDALTMAVTLDKAWAKRLVRDCGVPTAAFAVIEKIEDVDAVTLPYPLFVKPVAEGSGKGIGSDNKILDKQALRRVTADLLKRFHQPVLVEQFLSGREFTVAITGTGATAEVLGVSEILMKANYVGDGYGFINKEIWEDKVEIIAAPKREAEAAGEVALAAWQSLRCRDGGRVDIRCDGSGTAYFIEVNPLAGLRPDYSDMCFIATREGLSYQQLIGKIMDSFRQRYPDLKD